MTEPTSDLVKRLDDKCMRLIAMVLSENEVSNEDKRMAEFVDDRGQETDTYNLCCDAEILTQIGSADMGEDFRMVPAWWPHGLPAKWRAFVLDLLQQVRAIRALEAEVERSRKHVAALTTALELAGDEVVDFETTIRSRSNGAEPEFLSAAVKNDGVTARSQGASPISAFGSDSADALSEGGE